MKDNSITALHIAASLGDLKKVRYLLSHGADPEITNRNGQQPLFTSIFFPVSFDNTLVKNKEAVFKLLSKLTPNGLLHQDNNLDTVFQLMAQHGLKNLMMEALLQDKRGLFIPNRQSRYPIHTAILNHQIDIVDLLLSIPNIAELTDSNHQTALHYAALYGSKAMVELCCASSLSLINCIDGNHKTPLMLAIEADNREAIEVLHELKTGARSISSSNSTIKSNPSV